MCDKANIYKENVIGFCQHKLDYSTVAFPHLMCAMLRSCRRDYQPWVWDYP